MYIWTLTPLQTKIFYIIIIHGITVHIALEPTFNSQTGYYLLHGMVFYSAHAHQNEYKYDTLLNSSDLALVRLVLRNMTRWCSDNYLTENYFFRKNTQPFNTS